MKDTKNEKKKITKKSIKKGFTGSISILLCILLTPFLSVTLALVEYARYQQVMEVTDEIYELTGLSVLADYDPYIHNRFGLLATSQEGEFADGADELLENNIKILGNQVTLENPSFTGELSLANVETLRQQVVDFSELTATTAVMLEDFKLEELLEKLKVTAQFEAIMNTVGSLADLADALTKAVEKLEKLETSLKKVQSSINSAVSSAKNISSKMAELISQLGENGITNSSGMNQDYLNELKDIYSTAKGMVDNLTSVKSNLTAVKTSATEFVNAVKDARKAVNNVSVSNEVDSDGSISEAASSTMEEILKDMEDLVEDTVSEIKDETINTAKETVDKIINSALSSSGLKDVVGRYSDIVRGNYFDLPLSDSAKEDVEDFLSVAKSSYASHSGEELISFFKSKFIPDISIDIDTILNDIKEILVAATEKLVDSVGDKVISLLTNLVNVANGLFNLDVFYDPALNAWVDGNGSERSSYQDFMDALGDMLEAVDDFKAAMKKGNIFSKIRGALGAMRDMFASIGDLMIAIKDIALDSVENIARLGSSLVSGDVADLYEGFIISGYMRHNLPCRLDTGDYDYNSDSNKVKLKLTGTGLTGFEFDDIARQEVYSGQNVSLNPRDGSKFQGLASMLQNLKNGYGTDRMFKGAELEYIRAGTNSELANQVICFFDIYFLRLLLDLPSVFFTDTEVRSIATAATVASWVVYILYIVLEPLCDTILLVNRANVPLVKTKCWLTVTGLPKFAGKLGSKVLGKELKNTLETYVEGSVDWNAGADNDGEDYRTHMLIILLIHVDPNNQIQRLANLIDLEATEYYRQHGKSFSIHKTYTAVQVSADATFNPFFDLGTFTGGESLLPRFNIKQTVTY